MFRHLWNKLKFLSHFVKNSTDNKDYSSKEQNKNQYLYNGLQKNYNYMKNVFQDDSDIVYRKFSLGKIESLIIHIEGMSEKTTINENILKPLMDKVNQENSSKISINKLKESVINVNDVKKINTLEDAINGILKGDTALFLDGFDQALLISTSTSEHRNVQPPQTESVVRGPREGFTETLRVNTALIRRKIKDPDLKFENMTLGWRTKTDICIVYIKDIANAKIVEEVKRRIKNIDIDSILESGYIEAFIEDHPLTIFPTVGNTEKPDKFSAKILEGRVGILVDGTPFALTVPYLFTENFQVTEDYYSRPFFTTTMRLLRLLALQISLLAPAIYVALTTFHPTIIPTPLLITIAASREGTPFPAFIEVLLMGIMFELLREAGIRLPRPVGQAVSIVGGLVLGDAAVSAGLVGAPVVIIVALTGVTGFILPPQTDPLILLRTPFIILATFFGLYGIAWGFIVLLIHLASLRSFGVPFMSPFMPLVWDDLKDSIIRLPSWMMLRKPRILRWQQFQRNSVRANSDLKPDPAKNRNEEKND